MTTSGPSFFRTGIENKATGAEFEFNHVLRGDGLSWYFSGTYVNYWGSVTSGGARRRHAVRQHHLGRLVLGGLPLDGHAVPQPVAAAVEPGVDRDYKKGPYHIDPFLIYQVGAPYNIVPSTFKDPTTGAIMPDNSVHFARANYWASLDLGYDIVKSSKRTVTLGLNVRNVFNNVFGDVFPSTNSQYGKGQNPDLTTYGPGSVPNSLYYYAPDASPTQYQLYLRAKF